MATLYVLIGVWSATHVASHMKRLRKPNHHLLFAIEEGIAQESASQTTLRDYETSNFDLGFRHEPKFEVIASTYMILNRAIRSQLSKKCRIVLGERSLLLAKG